jgi:hypothetical protein
MTLIHLIRLKVFGFPHPGRERWRARVIKRPWRVIPGSTLYGALATALIKLDCDKESLKERDPKRAYKAHKSHGCGYGKLLDLLMGEESHIRFSPLVPADEGVEDARGYCKAAQGLVPTRLAPSTEEALRRRPNLFTTPHAPINRQRMVIHGDLLHAVTCHQPFQSYVGFIVEEVADAGESILPQLKRAFRALPFIPFGGRGKFCIAEGRVIKECVAQNQFLKKLKESLPDNDVWVSLLTPLVLDDTDWLLQDENVSVRAIPRFQLYRAWRRGLYREGGELVMYPKTPGHPRPLDPNTLNQSDAAPGLVEGSRFQIRRARLDEDFWRQFLWGFGHKDWTYLGWGQVIFDV